MSRPKSPTLTEGELQLMRVLWARGRATAGEVVSSLPGKRPRAYNTVLTVLRILERKGYVRHTKDGRAFTFHPIVDELQVRRRALRYFMSRFFDNSAELLVLNVLRDETVDADERRRLRRLIDTTPDV